MKMKSLKPSIVRFLKIILLFAIFFTTFFNFALGLLLFLIANFNVIKKSIFGRLPVKIDKHCSKGPFSYVYKDSLKLDLYYPDRQVPCPVVIFAHGGGWITGFKRQPNNLSWYKFLNHHGFAVASIDYRRRLSAKIDEIIDNYTEAVEFIHENAENLYLDPENIFLMGLSAGGHLSLYYACYESYKKGKISWLRGIVAFYPPTDLLDLWDYESTSIFARFSTIMTIKTLPSKHIDLYRLYSPTNWINEKQPPVFLAHGLRDTVVPVKSSIKFHMESKKKAESTLRIHPFGDHGFEFTFKDNFTLKILDDLITFLNKNCLLKTRFSENRFI
ncbi:MULTISPECIES: alpha/beta hydrolase [Pseudothermotoga]|jgi:acetyl esterase/lipase|uniref:Esterase n=1 Tax=Pseudothermotoga lettingae (strain ATCC BAA-301 / DSM 14385 / NBRC 107922 / TMO) TaxID=416591 RepID=A8F571_PSELT|nr:MULTISPECIES: alpha/beta hydrolase [Pseudothermotoga]KUK21154.1 MAG: Esterase [Pseudothermotoga lettingae]MDI3493951.1 hypothetical protein [Pseudothermotoga sp.]ABV33305.1 esterase [Pseudothermotoga lettingae TMO]MDK2884523.1 hypothetical protein [Pseudothermotoga sp.]GLI49778.1 esterase [Pseudothermotoga lettingae TMO]